MEPISAHAAQAGPPGGSPASDRRKFVVQLIASVVGLAAWLVPAVAGIVAWMNPLRQRGSAGRLYRIASLELLPEGGPPQRFPVIADRADAWNRFPAEPIGAVWLRRTGPATVEALSVTCPHAGCDLEYHGQTAADPQKRNRFACPCHNAIFELDGQRIEGLASDSPRPMDRLEVDTQRLQEGEVWVKFQRFETGIAKKVART